MAGEGSLENYYSLVDLVKKLGKEGVAQLMAKGKPQRISKGDMIYFLKSDVNRLLGEEEQEEEQEEDDDKSLDLIIEDTQQPQGNSLLDRLVFKETLIKRLKIGQDEEIYSNKILDLSQEVLYGRSKGSPELQKAFHSCGVISSLHAKLYLDDEQNLLYENLGANKSKVRGCKDKDYVVLEQNEIAVLIPSEIFQDIVLHTQSLSVSFKLGYQLKPHFVVRITVSKKV